MRYPLVWLVCIAIIGFGQPAVAAAYTLTFDEVPSGTVLGHSDIYRDFYGANFSEGFQAADHTYWTDNIARSSPNVLIWTGDIYSAFAQLLFGHYTMSYAEPYGVSSLSAYFSTGIDSVVRVTAYNWIAPNTLVEVASVEVGKAGEAWNNEKITIAPAGQSFNTIYFEGVSGGGLRGFCVDDMTVTPVPEPSSLAALFAGVAGCGGMLWRRRRA